MHLIVSERACSYRTLIGRLVLQSNTGGIVVRLSRVNRD